MLLRHSPPRFQALLLALLLPCARPGAFKNRGAFSFGRTSSGCVDDVDFGVFITGISALRPPPPACNEATRPAAPGDSRGRVPASLPYGMWWLVLGRGDCPVQTDGPGTRTNTRLTRRRRGLGLGRSYSLSGLARETVHVYAEHAVVPLFSSQEGLRMFARAPALTGPFVPPSVP